jgi:hypothetical protein
MYAYDSDTGDLLSDEDAEEARANPGIYRWVTFSDVLITA